MRIYYRISNNSTRRDRLKGATKENCLASFLSEFRRPGNVITLLPDNLTDPALLAFLSSLGLKQEPDERLGDALALRRALFLACREAAADEFVYFCEDDYAYLDGSNRILREGIEISDYATLYDHPDKYVDADKGGNPQVFGGGEKTTVLATASSHWKQTNSTTATFCVRARTLKADLPVWINHTAWEKVADYACFCDLVRMGRRLVSPLPGLATHCDLAGLSPFTDWDSKFKP